MATFNKFDDFVLQIGTAKHDLTAVGHVCKLALTNSAPVVSNTIFANITEIAAGNGYTAGGDDVTNTYTEAAGTATMGGTDVTVSASGGSIGPFRYVVMYNDTQTSPVDPLIGWWDYGSNLTLLDGESVLLDVGASLLTLA